MPRSLVASPAIISFLNSNTRRQVEVALQSLDEVGNVAVTRSTHIDGFTWIVTFASCRAREISGADVCNQGDVHLLSFASNGTISGCYGRPSTSSMVVVNGSAGESVDMVDLSDGPPYR